MTTAADVIDLKGGPAKFGRSIGRRPGTVRQWKLKNYFPRNAWPDIQEAHPDLTAEELKAIEAVARAMRTRPGD
jgi:hypothetical protein